MGKIPEYESINPLKPVPQDTEFAMGAAKTAGYADVARATSDVLKTVQTYEIQKDQIRARNSLTEQIISYESEKDQLYNDWENAYRDNPQGASDRLKYELEGLRDKYMEKSYNPWARNHFNDAVDRSNNATYRRALQFEDKALMENTMNTAKKGAEHLLSKLYREPTPKNYDASFKASEGVFQDLQNTFDPRTFEQMRDEFKTNAAQTMFQGMLDKDLVGPAQAALESKKYDEALGPDGISRVKNMIKRRKKMRVAKAKDYSELKIKNPYKYLQKMGVRVEPLDPTNPESFATRAALREDVKKDGVNLPMISPLEEISIFNALSQMEPRQRAEAFSKIGEVPKEYYVPFAKQIAETSPETAVAMDLLRDGTARDTKRAIDIFEGSDYLRKALTGRGESAVLPPRKSVDPAIEQALGSTYVDPQNREALRRTIRAVYARKRIEKNLYDTEFTDDDNSLIREVTKDLIGSPYNFNGKHVLPFRDENGNHANNAMMQAIVDSMSHDTLTKAFGSTVYVKEGKNTIPFNLEAGIDRIRPVKTKIGEKRGYALEFEGAPLFDNRGNIFLFDFKKFYEANKNNIKRKKGFWEKAWEMFGSGTDGIEANK